MYLKETHTVPPLPAPIRLLDYATTAFASYPTRTAAKKGLKRGEVQLNTTPADGSRWLSGGEILSLFDLELKSPQGYQLKLEVCYKDEHLAVIWKPAGIAVSGNRFKTVENALVEVLPPSKEPDALRWAKPVHRLDRPTTGLLIVARTARAIATLGELFATRQIKKRYHAVAIGALEQEGEIREPIDGKPAHSSYQLLKRVPSLKCQWLSLVKVTLHTGRTHQIRKHFAAIGHPLLGDTIYGEEGLIRRDKGLFLSAVELILPHPITGETLHIHQEHPPKFDSYLQREQRRFTKYNPTSEH